MTFGPATIQAFIAAILATLGWGICKRLAPEHEWLRMLVFGTLLALVLAIGPLVRLP